MNYKFSLKTYEIYQPIKEIIDDKNSKKYFVFLAIVYLIGYAAILRADVYYNDDLGRSLSGNSGWSRDFSRHLSEWFSKFVHMGWKISDISPLTQIIAILILSVSSILLVKIVNGRLRFVPILASSCIGLFPYFLENISYKFDSPYMAFSVLSSIVPFLWYKSSKRYFVISSIIGVLATLLTYQLASGVYIIILIFLLTKDYLRKNTPLKEIVTMMAFSSFSYTIAILMYYYIFMNETPHYNYVSTSVFSLSELHTGIYSNYKTYFSLIKNDLFDGFIGYAFLFLCLMYPIKLVLMSQRNKMSAIAISLLSFVFMALFLWGGVITLTKPLFAPRAYLGFCLFVGLLGSIEIDRKKILQSVNTLFVFVFVYSLISFSNSYGNALKSQDSYRKFRLGLVTQDLSKVVSLPIKNKTTSYQ